MHQPLVVTLLLLVSAFLLVDAQNGPIPARLSIPGAQPIPHRAQFRNEKIVRVRRPIALRSQDFNIPSVTQRIIEEPKPVTEAPEDEQPDVFLPQLLREQQLAQAQQAQFHQTAAQFFNNDDGPNSIQDAGPTLVHEEPAAVPQAPRFSERPAPARPQFNDYGIGSNIGSVQRYGLERQQPNLPAAPTPQRTNVIRSRPAVRESRPQYDTQALNERNSPPPPPPNRPRAKPIQSRPIDQNNLSEDRSEAHQSKRQQRPVSQTLRKWREENEDGSITWGYENDDGSFKEELIGTDCVTKGTYGYIDPDGNKREYHYETGIRCDPNTRETEEDLQKDGFINYEENRAVLPNGIEIDMSQLGKKKSKRPGAVLREQPAHAPQNQYYRN